MARYDARAALQIWDNQGEQSSFVGRGQGMVLGKALQNKIPPWMLFGARYLAIPCSGSGFSPY